MCSRGDGREPPPRRRGPGAREAVRLERRAAERVRGYARAIIAEIRREVERVPIHADDRPRRVRAAIRRARGRIRREWTAADLRDLLAECHEDGRAIGMAQTRALLRQPRGDARRKARPSAMAQKELPRREALEAADDVIARVRLRGTGEGLRALQRLPARAAEWIEDEAEAPASARDMEVGFDRAIEKILGRADLIGSEEAASAGAQAVRAALSDVSSGYYRWMTQEDDRVRDETPDTSHVVRHGVIYTWAEGTGRPGDEHPGDAINCRCWPEPVSREDLITAGVIKE